MAFARKYQDWTVDDWRRVVFSDETMVNRFGSDGRKWCWKRPSKTLQQNQVIPTASILEDLLWFGDAWQLKESDI